MYATRGCRIAAVTLAVGLFTAGSCGGQALPETTAKEMFIWVGTYAGQHDEGIHVCRFDLGTGKLTRVGAVSGIRNPSFQALHPSRRFLYSVSETSDFEGARAGSVCAYAVDRRTGALELLNRQSTMGAGPCHLSVDGHGRHVLAANYESGSVVVLPIRPDGSLDQASSFVQHTGSSVHPRQKGPHAHWISTDPAGQFVLAADLGLDQVLIYRYDEHAGQIAPNPEMPAAKVTPGAGPRHFAFHPQGAFGYLINELNSTVTAFTYDHERGALTAIQEISTLPADWHGESTTAEVAVSPDGKFLYGSNRGHDSIAVFAIDPQTGKLTAVSHHPALGEEPRHLAIDPTGAYLLASNQRSNNVVVFRVDRATGRLEPAGQQLEVPKPVCVTFLD